LQRNFSHEGSKTRRKIKNAKEKIQFTLGVPALLAAVGTAPSDQFPAVDQFVFVNPFHVFAWANAVAPTNAKVSKTTQINEVKNEKLYNCFIKWYLHLFIVNFD